jgi:UDP-N-acetylglucosamine 2-epimerase
MKLMTIFGTRPEAIKLAPVIKELEKDTSISHITCVTAQHREMLDQVLETFEIRPDYDLDIMKRNQDLSTLSAQILTQITEILKKEKPDFILVQGDTTTVLMASLAAFYQKIKVAHLEAGLRTEDILSPWPEEGNRRLVSAITYIHFAPTQYAKDKLLAENCPAEKILVTGNSVVDALLMTQSKINTSTTPSDKFQKKYPLAASSSQKLLVTLHRRETHGEKILEICTALKELANERTDLNIIFSVHPNPNVKNVVNAQLGDIPNVHLIEPPAYLEFIYLMIQSTLILTDSGGIQEEAPSLNIPVLVARDKTERPEGIEAGSSILVGRNGEHIKKTIHNFLDDQALYNKHANIANPFGNGTTAKQVLNYFKNL